MSQPQGTESTIRNTTAAMKDDPAESLLLLATGAVTGSADEFIGAQERSGQAQLVNSDRLPTKLNGGTDDEFVSVGFTFGEAEQDDPMFRPATLPAGWKREGSDHAMWSYILDQHGRRRVSIFYKAAFYDRDAFMGLDTPYSYLSSALYNDTKVVLDDEWLTREIALAELEKAAAAFDDRATEAGMLQSNAQRDDDYWAVRETEHRARAAKARALAASL